MRLQHNLLRLVAVLGGISSIALTTPDAWRDVPVRVLSQPDATSAERYGNFESVRSLNQGRVLLNDNGNRRLLLLDSALRLVKVVLDTDSSDAFRYGNSSARLYPYRTDSSAIKDAETQYSLILDAEGNIDHRRIRAKPGEAPMPFSGTPVGYDQDGNGIVFGSRAFIRSAMGQPKFSSDLPVQRVNTNSRQYEQVGRVDLPNNSFTRPSRDADGNQRIIVEVGPLRDRAPVVSCDPNAAMIDHLPAFLENAAIPDLDAELWIRTTNIAGLAPGESLYDVIDNRGQLVQRVRVPAGRAIVGFGHDGIVYLTFRDGTNGWALERTHIGK